MEGQIPAVHTKYICTATLSRSTELSPCRSTSHTAVSVRTVRSTVHALLSRHFLGELPSTWASTCSPKWYPTLTTCQPATDRLPTVITANNTSNDRPDTRHCELSQHGHRGLNAISPTHPFRPRKPLFFFLWVQLLVFALSIMANTDAPIGKQPFILAQQHNKHAASCQHSCLIACLGAGNSPARILTTGALP